MKKIKNLSLIFIIIFFNACGYEPLNKNNSGNTIFISEKIFLGNNKINRKIFNKLNLEENNSGFIFELNSMKNIDGVSKDKSGNITTYKTTITTLVSLIENEKVIKSKTFSKSFNYSNIINKFDLSKYQKDVEKNLINSISNDIKIFLYN
tara:strand:+ start:952 stop:1401 length:450 start_codon:yes stop_codon:yes gene_type:complete